MSVSDEQLKHAHALAAEVVASHNAIYAPVFDVLDAELQRREQRRATIAKAASGLTTEMKRELRRKSRNNRQGRDVRLA